jgi:5'-3' exonuclease
MLDTNCLIHPKAFDVLAENKDWKNLEKLELDMLENICDYLEQLVRLSQPQELLMIAIDGPAPMAKLAQQRTRRFKSIRDRDIQKKIKEKHGVPAGNFWSNSSITPGTNFMDKITKTLSEYVTKQKPIWQTEISMDLKIILSTANQPGEGEHKIMEYIRKTKCETDATVIYGLDADLFFLAMCSECSNIWLLREQTQFNAKHLSPSTTFGWCDIDAFKEIVYVLYAKYGKLNDPIWGLENNKKRLIYDYVFMCYLMGNDFLPTIPSLDIYHGGMESILECYGKIQSSETPRFVLSENYDINLDVFGTILDYMTDIEHERLGQLVYKSKRKPFKPSGNAFEIDMWKWENLYNYNRNDDPVQLGKGHPNAYKIRYYTHHFSSFFELNPDQDKNRQILGKRGIICQEYINGLRWIAKYYFKGVPSWDYSYPYRHAPLVSDIAYMISQKKTRPSKFNKKSKPLLPLAQLISVLPVQSTFLLPKIFREIHSNKQLKKYYPTEFELDYLYKTKEFLGIPLIPSLPYDLVTRVLDPMIKQIRNNAEIMKNNPSRFTKSQRLAIREGIEYLDKQNYLTSIDEFNYI